MKVPPLAVFQKLRPVLGGGGTKDVESSRVCDIAGGEGDDDENEGYDEDGPSELTASATFPVVRGHGKGDEGRGEGGGGGACAGRIGLFWICRTW